jgi:hypothetical protein
MEMTMSVRVLVPATAVATVVGFGLTVAEYADATKLAFPNDYAKGVRWLVVDNEAQKQVREIYAPQQAVESARKGEAMPDGMVITLVRYSAKLDPQGSFVRDQSARLIKNEILGINVMQKGKGWGAEYPDALRNGEWEYRAFRADNTPSEQANLLGCFGCHKAQASQDYIYEYDKLKTVTE